MAARRLAANRRAPITSNEFYESFKRLLTLWAGESTPIKPQSVGISVSGGADSMALAYLFKTLAQGRLSPNLKVTPFILDHKARNESTEEAHKVAGWLRNLGFEPRILTLQWPQGTVPSLLTDFESQARRLRYQALGKACRSIGIRLLCMGHHQDDTVESVLIRLAAGHRGMGLQGMHGVAQIPECQGIYGVCGSGISPAVDTTKSSHKGAHPRKSDLFKKWPMEIAPDGVFLFRPLLSYPKARLVSTCERNNVPFVLDKTNFDPTLTPRNTVRHLLAHNLLPRALRAPSILGFAKSSISSTESLMRSVDKFMGRVRIHKLDVQAGTLVVEFPPPDQIKTNLSPSDRMVHAVSLRRLIDLVSPFPANAASLQKLQLHALKVLPSADPSREEAATASQDVFTVGGVMFQPVTMKVRQKAGSRAASRIENIHLNRRKDDKFDIRNNPNIWLLSREPFSSKISNNSLEYKLDIPNPSLTGVSTEFSEWCLWDNRYWIRVRATQVPTAYKGNSGDPSKQTISLVVRPLEQKDITSTHDLLQRHCNYKNKAHNQDIEEKNNSPHKPLTNPGECRSMLKRNVPGSLRFTIPVIAEAGVSGRVLGFPSFGRRVPAHIRLENEGSLSHWQVEWEVQYKNIDSNILDPPNRWKD